MCAEYTSSFSMIKAGVRKPRQAFTVTFGDRGENEAGMQMIGQDAGKGVSVEHLVECKKSLDLMGIPSYIYDLGELVEGVVDVNKIEPAAVLVVKGGVSHFLKDMGEDAEAKVLSELESMPKDTTSFSYGQVRNKHARHNNTIGDFDQQPDIANRKGTVVNFKDYPHVDRMRRIAGAWVDAPFPLVGELNDYFDADKCGIGWHGDLERKLVVGMRVGPGANGMPLLYQWFHRDEPVGREARIVLDSGDIYIMSEKAVGFDWKLRSKYTLRHAAGKASCSYSKTKRKRDDPKHVVVTWKPK